MRRIIGVALSTLLVLGMLGVGAWQLLGGRLPSRAGAASPQGASSPANLAAVRAVVGSEKKAFFADPDVKAIFARSGISVDVDTAGSREIATSTDLKARLGVPLLGTSSRANQAQDRDSRGLFTVLLANGDRVLPADRRSPGTGRVAKKAPAGYWTFDVNAYLKLVAKGTRWDQIPGNTSYPATKTILVTTTDVRRSNSAAMYLAMASYAANGNRIVSSHNETSAVLPAMRRLFLGQGFTESSTEAPFEDYLALGEGKTPILLTYESLFLDRQLRKDGSISKDMVLMYPTPDVLSKHTVLALTKQGAKVGELLSQDPDLQRLAAQYGFRTTNPTTFRDTLTKAQVALPPELMNIVEPPSYEVLESMIAALEKQY